MKLVQKMKWLAQIHEERKKTISIWLTNIGVAQYLSEEVIQKKTEI